MISDAPAPMLGIVSVAEFLVVAAWAVILAPGLRAAVRTPRRLATGLLLLGSLGAGAYALGLAGDTASRPPNGLLTAAGLTLCLLGIALHRRARRALGPAFATRPVPPPDGRLVTTGPYGVIRHPLYAAVFLIAAGTLLVYRSPPTLGLFAGLITGLVWKLRREEAVLAAALGASWEAYAARVPALVPRFRRAARP